MSDEDTERKRPGGSRRSRGRSRRDDRSTRTRHTRSRSRSLRRPRNSLTRPSRSRSRRDDRASRTRPSRSRRRSSSVDSTESLRQREQELIRKREQLKILESEVRCKRSRINDEREVRSLPALRASRGQARSKNTPRNHRHIRDRCLRTPAKERSPDFDGNKNEKHKATSSLLDEFVKLLKSKTGHSESFSGSSLNNVIPEFDPMSKEQTVNVWLDKVEECSEIYNWNDKQTIHYALPKLTGLAKTWYQGLPSIKHTWTEWKDLLRESFPATENYAELLTDMLNRRVRPGESFEMYYFAKINLLNRCKIFGKQAVDCLLYAIDDRGVRVGAQAAKFDKPEDVLEFFKTIKSNNRNQLDNANNMNRDRRPGNTNSSLSKPSDVNGSATKSNSQKGTIKCFNCQGVGHPSFKCPKPLLKCTTCNFIGHDSLHCTKTKENPPKEKSVLRVSVSENTSDKYKILINVNGIPILCQVDLGSEATLIQKNAALQLGITWKEVTGPYLTGLGNVPYLPLGFTFADIEVQGIIERNVEVFIVDDHLMKCNILLGHSYTERPTLTIIKTPKELKFERTEHVDDIKVELNTACDVSIDVGEMISVPVKSNISCHGNFYVNGSIRGPVGQEYYLMPGEYQVKGVNCNLFIQNVSSTPLHFKENTLITRAKFVGSSKRVLHISNDLLPQESVRPKCGEQLTDSQKRQCEELLSEFKDCFSTGMHDLGFTNVTEMEIHLKDTTPVVYRPYRLAHSERKLVQDMVSDMLDHGIVRESESPYASPIVLVKKKSGEKRLCVDYRALNSRTKRDHYPLPHIEDLLDQLSGQSLFTSLDLASGYHQIPIAENSREKTAFVTPDGLYEYNRVPFGLANAPAVFQRAIHKVLSKSKVSYVVIYMDDILIPSKSFEEGLERLKEVLGLLKEAGFTLKMEKCHFFQEKIDFLGFEIDQDGIRPGLSKTEAVAKFPTPTNQHEIRRFLGLASFFRRFVKGFAVLARPLTNLLRKDTPW
ncbi:uncharacterized protein LOC134805908 [Cydia splendana]|uniref:uncharacterized protein LOC134805908 n=1 Tax=Cydia splendana TaxID=1100963 RepID=UPI00300D902B